MRERREVVRASNTTEIQSQANYFLNGGFLSDLPARKPVFEGPESLLPREEDFREYVGFLDAEIRYHRVKVLLDFVEGFTKQQ